MIPALITALTPVLGDVLRRVLPDEDSARKAETAVIQALDQRRHELDLAAAAIIRTEAQAEHPLTAQWRPVLMLVITAILANNYLLAPYLELLTGVTVMLALPERLWDLLTIGVGGYVVGRSAEKSVALWRGKGGS